MDRQIDERKARITADLDGSVDSEEVRLGEEDALALDAELADLRLGQLHLAPAAAALHEAAHHLVHRRPLHRPHRGPRHHHLPALFLPARRWRRRRVAEEERGGDGERGWNVEEMEVVVDEANKSLGVLLLKCSKPRQGRSAVGSVMDGL